VLSIASLDDHSEPSPVSPSAGPPPPDNTPTPYERPVTNLESLIAEDGSRGDSPLDSPFTSPGKKTLYVRGLTFPASGTRRRLFPSSPEGSSRQASEAVPEQPHTGDTNPPRSQVLGDRTNSLTKRQGKSLREPSAYSDYLDIPEIERDFEGICHVPVLREPSSETVNISLPSRPPSYSEYDPQARIFTPIGEAPPILLNKRDSRLFGDDAQNKVFKSKVAPLIDFNNDETSQVSTYEDLGRGSPNKLRLRQVPNRTSSKIPIKSPKKVDSPEQTVKPSWRFPTAEDISTNVRQSISPTKITTPPAPRSPENKWSPTSQTPKDKKHKPPMKKLVPVTPRKCKLESKSMNDMHVANSSGQGPPETSPTPKRAAMTLGRMQGSRDLMERDRDVTVKVTRSQFPQKPDLHISIPHWLSDAPDCVGLGLAPPLTTESQATTSTLGQGSHDSEQNYGLESGDSASNWDAAFDEHVEGLCFEACESPNMPSPTPSSQLGIPWTSTKKLANHDLYSELAKAEGDDISESPKWPSSLRRVLPSVERVDGSYSINFQSSYNTGTCRITLAASIFAGKRGPGGWHAVTIPGLPTQDAEWGSIALRVAGDDDPPPVEFESFGIHDANIELPECISGFFDPTSPLQIGVRFKEAVHNLEKFEVASDIQAAYKWDVGQGLWVYYAASCTLRDFGDTFAADTCRFTLYICNGPPGTMIDTLGDEKRNVSFDREGLIEVGNPAGGMKVSLFRPASDVGAPFTLTWKAYLGIPPISVAMPKICAHPLGPGDEDEKGRLISNKTLPLRLKSDIGSLADEIQTPQTWPPKLQLGPGARYRRTPLEAWDIFEDEKAGDALPHEDEAESFVTVDDGVIEVEGVSTALSSVRKLRGRKALKLRRRGPNWKSVSKQMCFDEGMDMMGVTPRSPKKYNSIQKPGRNTHEANQDDYEKDPSRQSTRAALKDLVKDVIRQPWFAPVDIIGGICHIMMKLLMSAFVFFVGIFSSRKSAQKKSRAEIARKSRGTVKFFKYFFYCIFTICMARVLNSSTDRAAVMIRDEWSGKTNYGGRGTVVARGVVGWVGEKTEPLVAMVEEFVEGNVLDDVLWLIVGDRRGGDEALADQLTVTETMPVVVEKAPGPAPTWRPETMKDYVDWVLGWTPLDNDHQ
jgi:hypothetical protein